MRHFLTQRLISPWLKHWPAPLTSPLSDPATAGELPETFELYQKYPNPFNPSTKIRHELPESSEMRLSAYDMLAREVSVLVNEKKAPGSYEVKFDAAGLSSGVYVCRLTAGYFAQTRTMLLLK